MGRQGQAVVAAVADGSLDDAGGPALEEAADDGPVHRNEVLLVGRVSGEPVERVMPSGDIVLGFRLAVRRDPASRSSAGGRVVADGLECAAWRAGLRRTIATWKVGDVVQVSGALHRRVRREDGQTTSRYEIEVSAARRVRRANR
ncbi:MAG TPA: single-stranded DNA-binding protein [Motilibacteraceae bacterium]|nr:single-stranded DNA-binding protein [Motilibacteraceae bacterium]